MLHPKAYELSNVLMGFLFERGDQVVQVEASAAPSLQHVAKRRAENSLTVTILQAVEKQNALRADDIIGFRLTCSGVCGNGAEQSTDNLRADL